MSASPASFAPSFGDYLDESRREPLSPAVRRGLLALVIFFHVGGVWALTQIEPAKLIVGQVAPMEVRMVTAEPAAVPDPPQQEALPPEPTPPPPDLATMVEPPPPDLPPPVFPIQAPPPKPPEPVKPKPLPPKPVQRPPTPAAPVEAAPQPAAPAPPKTVSVAQVRYLVPPSPTYPASSRRSGEQGVATVRVLVDITGRPTQVSLQVSSGHTALDESALSAVRAAHFRPYAEGGIPQAVWVLIPVKFVLQ